MTNDAGDPPNDPDGHESPGDDPIARLLRLTGPRRGIPEERSERVRSAVHARWRAEVRAGQRRRLLVWATVSIATSATVLMVIRSGGWSSVRDAFAPKRSIATLLRVEGVVRDARGAAMLPGARILPGSALLTGSDGRAALLLAGVASVRLDHGTLLRIASGSALELARGAVYVDTGPRPGHASSVEIRTDIGLVRDLGTQFEVRLADGEGMRVSVREGIAGLAREGHSYIARAGTQLVVHGRGAVETRTVPGEGEAWNWVLAIAPAFDLEGRALGEYLAWVARETGWGVRFDDEQDAPGALKVVLHGSVAGLRPDESLAAVLPVCGLRYTVVGGTVVIERPRPGAEPR